MSRHHKRAREDGRDSGSPENRDPAMRHLHAKLKRFIDECSKCALRLPKNQITQRYGGVSAQNTIMDTFEKNAHPATLQYSYALALRGTSGVGKTYLSFSYPSGNLRLRYEKRKWSHVCIYAGFNSECPGTNKETTFLYAHQSDKDEGVGAVSVTVMARVVGQLAAILAAKCPERSQDVDLHQFAPKVSADAFTDCDPEEFGAMTDILIDCAVKQLCAIRAIHQKRGSTKTTVLVNVDEAQFLDKRVHGQGARYALRILRQLQLLVTAVDKNIALVGMSTGINPEVSLTTATEGRNIPIDQELLSRDECIEIALGYLSNVADPLPPTQRVMTAERLYPRVRDVLMTIDGMPITNMTCKIKTPKVAALLIEHHIKQEPLDYVHIPEGIHTVGYPSCTDSGIPYLDVATWPTVLKAIKLKPSLAPYTTHTTPDVFNCYSFEDSAFDVLLFTVSVFFTNLNCMKNVGKVFRKQQQYFTMALGLRMDTTFNILGCEQRLSPDHVLHPFSDKAHKNLSPAFENEWNELTSDGTAVMLRLGKDSAADYMLLRREGDKVKAWYGDAKTHMGGADPITRVKNDACSFEKKIDGMHRDLVRLISSLQLSHKLDEKYTCSIITHVAVDEDTVASWGLSVTVLCPETFVCEPWTKILFGEATADEYVAKQKGNTFRMN